MVPVMTIELVTTERGQEWWVKVNGTGLVCLDLSPKAKPREVRDVAYQKLSRMVEVAQICLPLSGGPQPR